MSTRIDAFLSEVRNMPEFIAELAIGPTRPRELIEGLERGISGVDRLANDDPAVVEIYDEILATIGRRDLSTKEKLSALGKLLLQAADTMKKVN